MRLLPEKGANLLDSVAFTSEQTVTGNRTFMPRKLLQLGEKWYAGCKAAHAAGVRMPQLPVYRIPRDSLSRDHEINAI